MTWALRLPSTCLLISNPSLAGARDLARWSEILGANTPERHTMMVLNHPTAHGGLNLADFTRACGRAPDVNIPYDRELAEAAPLGIKAMQKCKAFHRGLSRIVRDFTGEETEEEAVIPEQDFRLNGIRQKISEKKKNGRSRRHPKRPPRSGTRFSCGSIRWSRCG